MITNQSVEASQEAKVDMYADCPEHAGYEYDKDMYLANDRYAEMVDNDIATLMLFPAPLDDGIDTLALDPAPRTPAEP